MTWMWVLAQLVLLYKLNIFVRAATRSFNHCRFTRNDLVSIPLCPMHIYIHSIHIVYIRKYVMWIVSRKSRKWFVCAMCWLRGALPWHDNVAWCTIVQVTTRSSNRQQSFIVHVARFCGLVWCAMGASPLKYCMSPCCLMLFLHHPFGVKLFSFRTFPYVRVQNMHLRLMKLPAL